MSPSVLLISLSDRDESAGLLFEGKRIVEEEEEEEEKRVHVWAQMMIVKMMTETTRLLMLGQVYLF